MNKKIYLCCDLDRTLLPNGPQPESPQARPLFRKLANNPEVILTYVSGRHKALLLDAIQEYDIPIPNYAIGDVGTTIYEIDKGNWQPWDAWQQEIAKDWRNIGHNDLSKLLANVDDIKLQEPAKQNTYKLSYYVTLNINRDKLFEAIRKILDEHDINATLIWSIDEVADTGLLDILPSWANKLHAIEFLIQHNGFDPERTVFAGDSGNDLPVLSSGLQAILVHNAQPEVRKDAIQLSQATGHAEKLYLAKGEFHGMNGNYAAGILEGLVHFLPEVKNFI